VAVKREVGEYIYETLVYLSLSPKEPASARAMSGRRPTHRSPSVGIRYSNTINYLVTQAHYIIPFNLVSNDKPTTKQRAIDG
jgi:hypothetical protein